MRGLACLSMLLLLPGCHIYSIDIDGRIVERSAARTDVQPAALLEGPIEVPVQSPAQKAPKTISDRLHVPEPLPGAKTPDIKVPSFDAPKQELEAAIKKQFPPLPAYPKLAVAQPGPERRPLALEDLQRIAAQNSPKIRQAHLNVDAARGIALQAGLHPNPIVGYESSSIGQGNGDGFTRTAGQQGGFVEQTIKTAGKLQLARGAALMDVQIAEQNLRQAESELQSRVRSGYFAVLAARESYQLNHALTVLTDEVYNVLVERLRVGQAAHYEPMQIRVLALQARGQLVQAHNRYTSAWKQLAATLGTPTMPLTEVAGKIDAPVPHFEQARVLAYVLERHTEVLSAQYGVDKARQVLRLAEVQPIPDVTVHVAVQKDYTTAPFGTIANVTLGVPVPFWDRNQGNIHAARAQLQRAMQDQQRVQNDLTARIADAFERYDNNRVLLQMYKEQILPNQVQAFRAAVINHDVAGGVAYNDLINAQQSLASLVATYLTTLSDQWTAVVDIAALLQTKDLFQLQQTDEVAPIPPVGEMIRDGWRQRR